MSPLLSSPNRGYADWQRVENWDTGQLWAFSANNINATQISPVLDVSRSTYLGGWLANSFNLCRFQANWFLDQAATVGVGERDFILSQNIPNAAQIRIPNLGPFVQITLGALGVNYSPQVEIFGTNRYHPLEFIPVWPVAINQSVVSIPANTTQTYWPNDYYAGPVSAHVQGQQAGQLQLWGYNQAGNAQQLDEYDPAANAATSVKMVTPPGPWFVTVKNLSTTAAGLFSTFVTTSQTGST